MKVLDFEVNEKTVKDVAFLDGDIYNKINSLTQMLMDRIKSS